jgi:predicted RNA binding protein YcfA (HicA-like mRNA interferase family)
LDRVNGSHHVYVKTGNPSSIPVPVHKNKSLKKGTLLGILKRAGLTKADL